MAVLSSSRGVNVQPDHLVRIWYRVAQFACRFAGYDLFILINGATHRAARQTCQNSWQFWMNHSQTSEKSQIIWNLLLLSQPFWVGLKTPKHSKTKTKQFEAKSKAFKQIQMNPKNAKTFQKIPEISKKKHIKFQRKNRKRTHTKKNEMECSGMFWMCPWWWATRLQPKN